MDKESLRGLGRNMFYKDPNTMIHNKTTNSCFQNQTKYDKSIISDEKRNHTYDDQFDL